jgi:hypothetical protein
MTRMLRGLSFGVLMLGLVAVGTPADAAHSIANPTRVTDAAQALGVSGTPHTIEIEAGDNEDTVRLAFTSAAAAATTTDPQFVLFSTTRALSNSISVGENVYVVLADDVSITNSDTDALVFTGAPSGAYGGTWIGPGNGSSSLVRVNATGVKLAHLTLSNAATYGVRVPPGASAALTEVTVTGGQGHGISVENGAITLNDSSVSDNHSNGLALNAGSSAVLNRSKINGNGPGRDPDGSAGDGISVNAGSSATLVDTAVDGNGVNGIAVNGPSTLTVTDGEISNNRRHGIGTSATSAGAPKITFANTSATPTYVNENAYNGILAVGGTDAYLQYVRIKRTKAYALSVDHSTVRLKGSLLDASGLNNASIRNGSTVKFYKDNTVSNAKGGSYDPPGDDTLAPQKGHGIAASGRSKLTIHDPGNSFSANHYYGILVSESGTSGLVYSKAGSVKFSSNGVGPGKVQNDATFKLESGFSTTEFPNFRVDSGGRFTRQ